HHVRLRVLELNQIEQPVGSMDQPPAKRSEHGLDPAPGALRIEGGAAGIEGRLRDAVESGSVMREGRAGPDEIGRDVRPGAGIGEPGHPFSGDREVEAIRMAMPARKRPHSSERYRSCWRTIASP